MECNGETKVKPVNEQRIIHNRNHRFFTVAPQSAGHEANPIYFDHAISRPIVTNKQAETSEKLSGNLET